MDSGRWARVVIGWMFPVSRPEVAVPLSVAFTVLFTVFSFVEAPGRMPRPVAYVCSFDLVLLIIPLFPLAEVVEPL